jgi:hypothetical protein
MIKKLYIGVDISKRITIYTIGVYSSSPSHGGVGSRSTLNKITSEFW